MSWFDDELFLNPFDDFDFSGDDWDYWESFPLAGAKEEKKKEEPRPYVARRFIDEPIYATGIQPGVLERAKAWLMKKLGKA